MSALAENLNTRLREDTPVRVALGSPTGDTMPIHPGRAPDGATLPLVVWLQVASTNNESHGEASQMDDTLLQLSCYAATYAEARDLRRAVRNALENKPLDGGERLVDFTERDLFEPLIDAFHCVLECHALHDALAGAS